MTQSAGEFLELKQSNEMEDEKLDPAKHIRQAVKAEELPDKQTTFS